MRMNKFRKRVLRTMFLYDFCFSLGKFFINSRKSKNINSVNHTTWEWEKANFPYDEALAVQMIERLCSSLLQIYLQSFMWFTRAIMVFPGAISHRSGRRRRKRTVFPSEVGFWSESFTLCHMTAAHVQK